MMRKRFARTAAAFLAAITLGTAASIVNAPVMAIEASAADSAYDMTSEYKSGRFYRNLSSLTLTGDGAHDTLAVALSQVGYHEGDSEAELDGESSDGSKDFVEYNVLYGKLGDAQGGGLSYGYYWCASFVNWCLRQAGVSEAVTAGAEVSCERWLQACREGGIYNSKNGYLPSSGDMIFFRDIGSSRSATHIGLVLSCDGTRVYTVEGNTSGGNGYSENGEYVALKSYELSNAYIAGYASPKYEGRGTGKTIDYSGDFLTKGEYISTDKLSVYRSTGLEEETGAFISAFSVFDVTEVGKDHLKIKSGELTGYIKRDGSAVQATTHEKVFTINYLNDDGDMIYFPQYRVSGQAKNTYTNTPKRDKSGFVGWRLEDSILSAGGKLPTVDRDITLTSVWDDTLYTVCFKTADGTELCELSGYYGDPVEPPTPQAPEGYIFTGWDTEVSAVIQGNITYTAAFVPEGELDPVSAEPYGCTAAASGILSVAALCAALGTLVFRKKEH